MEEFYSLLNIPHYGVHTCAHSCVCVCVYGKRDRQTETEDESTSCDTQRVLELLSLPSFLKSFTLRSYFITSMDCCQQIIIITS